MRRPEGAIDLRGEMVDAAPGGCNRPQRWNGRCGARRGAIDLRGGIFLNYEFRGGGLPGDSFYCDGYVTIKQTISRKEEVSHVGEEHDQMLFDQWGQ